MAGRAKLTFSFCAILLLFGVNFGVYFWTVKQRNVAVQNVDQALSRVAVLSAIHQDLDNLTKEIALLSQLKSDQEGLSPDPKDQQAFFQRVEGVKAAVSQLRQLCDPGHCQEVSELSKSFDELAQSWSSFYQNLGVHQAKAVSELAARADPLSEHVVGEVMPDLRKDVNEQAQAARAAFSETTRWADEFTFFAFILSLTLASLLAVVGLQSAD